MRAPLLPRVLSLPMISDSRIHPDRRFRLATALRRHLAGNSDSLLHVRKDVFLVPSLNRRPAGRIIELIDRRKDAISRTVQIHHTIVVRTEGVARASIVAVPVLSEGVAIHRNLELGSNLLHESDRLQQQELPRLYAKKDAVLKNKR